MGIVKIPFSSPGTQTWSMRNLIQLDMDLKKKRDAKRIDYWAVGSRKLSSTVIRKGISLPILTRRTGHLTGKFWTCGGLVGHSTGKFWNCRAWFDQATEYWKQARFDQAAEYWKQAKNAYSQELYCGTELDEDQNDMKQELYCGTELVEDHNVMKQKRKVKPRHRANHSRYVGISQSQPFLKYQNKIH